MEPRYVTDTNAEVCALADERGVDRGVALDRLNEWRLTTGDSAVPLTRQQLASVVIDASCQATDDR